MSTILMRTDLLADARVLRIVSLTRVDKMRVVGALYWLWSIAQTQSNDGVIECLTEQLIDEQVELPGFAKAVAAVGWLVLGDDTVTIPDFDSYFGKSSKTRSKERLKKARQRWDRKGGEPERPIIDPDRGANRGHTGDTIGTTAHASVPEVGDKQGTASGHVGTADRIGSDRSGSEQSGSLSGASEVTPASRFVEDRKARTGEAPPGFAAFIAEYPQGRAVDRGGLLTLWGGLGLEDDAQAVLAGLRAWAGSESWRDGYAPKARKFLEERHWETKPPPPKPVTDRFGKPVKPSGQVSAKATDAQHSEFKAWWRCLLPDAREAFATSVGVVATVVDQELNNLRLRADWYAKYAAAAAQGGAA